MKTFYTNSYVSGEVNKLVYICSMHPEVISDKPGKCPKCGMQLELRKENIQNDKGGEYK